MYRVGILLVTVAMLLLPVCYLALIAVVAFLLYYHATEHLRWFSQIRSVWVLIFGYAGPLIAGAILLFFMIKPLFARHSRSARLRSLEFGQEPLLFALVTRVARAVGAPEPRRIDVDCQVNASAGFGDGFSGFFGRNLVLTIGLPLVAGLTVQQLAGVIAHELGHFTQGTGMRLSYVIRSINHWFVRVVYERDDWDDALVGWSQESDRLVVIFLLARLGVWLTRRVLWLLMMLGHGISCFLLRQMEYDADRYEIRLAGSEAFAETSRTLMVLDLTSQVTMMQLFQGWQHGRLPDDLCPLVEHVAGQFTRKQRRKLEKELAKVKTGLFDTHPSLSDRLANARREDAPGIFHLDWPASRLFGDFPKLTRAVTLDFYRAVFGKRVRRQDLIPAAAFLPQEPEPEEPDPGIPLADA
jgi:Zn-dependent protease with chaperone function